MMKVRASGRMGSSLAFRGKGSGGSWEPRQDSEQVDGGRWAGRACGDNVKGVCGEMGGREPVRSPGRSSGEPR